LEILTLVGIALLDLPDHVHSFPDLTEGSETLTIFIPFPTEIKSRLIVDTNEKVGSG
jgi:hypothetical protein